MADRLPSDEWLGAAKSLHVGQKRRINHGCGRTAACDVFNNADSWSAYCHRCHIPGYVPKQFQSIQRVQVDPDRVQPVPADAIHILQASRYEQSQIWQLLVQKGCPPGVVPEEMLWYSKLAGRILLRQGLQALGRSLNPLRQPKWLMYGEWYGTPRLWWTRYRAAGPTVLVEDALSSLKVAKAIELYAPGSSVSVCATLGTTVTAQALPLLAGRSIICMYDGDAAGKSGAASVRQRLAVFGGAFHDRRPVSGDPKDMELEVLYESIKDLV